MKQIVEKAKDLFTSIFDWFAKMNLLQFSLISFLIIGINYLPLVTKLGYFLDDWPQLYSWIVRGAEGTKSYWIADSRWFTWWIHYVLFPILGAKPVFWHLIMFGLRWITSILCWSVFSKIWSDHKFEITVASLLFGIYPLFAQQSISITFSSHFVCFTLFLTSLLLMVLSYRHKRWFIPLTLIGVLIDLLNLISYEYYLGLEFLRPIILFVLVNRQSIAKKQKISQVILRWLPWFVADFGYLIWRGFLINVPTLRSPILFENLKTAPFQAIIDLVQVAIKDFVQIVFYIWTNAFKPEYFDFSLPINLYAWGIAIMVFVLSILVFRTMVNREQIDFENSKKWQAGFVLFGTVAVLFGAAPGWSLGRSVSDPTGIWNDRFGIASMIGASIIIVGLVISLIKSKGNLSLAFLALFFAFATGINFRNMNDYRWSTIYQTRFYNQLVWRAPSIEANTAFLADKELFPKMGAYPTSYALNTIYNAKNNYPYVDYWFYTISHYFKNNFFELDQGIELNTDKWYTKFSTLSTDSLVIYWDYQSPSCLWMLDQNDRNNPFVSDVTREVLGASNLSRIADQQTDGYPPEDIFGEELGHGWCYYFEKADLAKQLQQWEKITVLYDETVNKGYNTNFGPELTPFIFGYAMTGDYSKALELTRQANTMAEKMSPYLCDQWQAIYDLSEPSELLEEAYQGLLSDLHCGI